MNKTAWSTSAVIMGILIVIASYAGSLQFSISDTDPSTYAIIPLLMLPLFLIFKLKEKVLPKADRKDIAAGAVIFAAALALTMYAKSALSLEYSAFSIGLLILPLIILSFVAAAFGIKNAGKFKDVIIYSLFASPLLLLPVLMQNQLFTEANSAIVYGIVKLLIPALQFFPPLTITLNGISIGIGQSCVGLGAIFGLFFLLLPIAYFYNGKPGRKLSWAITGIVLLLALNIMRMTAITTLWLTYGPSQTLATAHLFAGILLFYISLVVMMLAAPRFGLSIPKFSMDRGKNGGVYLYSIAAPVIFAIIYLAIFSYGNTYISPMNFAANPNFNFTQNATVQFFNSAVNMKNYTSEILIYDNNTLATLLIYNNTTTKANVLEVTLSKQRSDAIAGLIRNSTIEESYTLMNSSGYITNYALASSEGRTFYIFERSALYQYSPYNYTAVKEYAIIPEGLFGTISPRNCGNPDWRSALLNIANPATYNSTESAAIYYRYCTYDSLVSR